MGRHQRLPQAQSTVSGRHFTVGKYFKAALLEVPLQPN